MLKKIIYLFLKNKFGKKRYHRFFLIMKNLGIQGLNYKSTDIDSSGEKYFITTLVRFYSSNNSKVIIFDVGANIGNYAKALLQSFKENFHIYSFEPFSTPFKQLALIKNERLTLVNKGLSDKKEELLIHTSDEYSEIGGVYDRTYAFSDIPHDKTEKCQFITIDDFCFENSLAKINFLKIDVEGHELAVLQGAKKTIENGNIDFIQFEFGSGNIFSKTSFMDFHTFLNKKYNIYRLLKDGIMEIETYSTDYEMFILTNFICIKKELVNDYLLAND
jgi:FkbM family methyltransferase